MQRRNNLREKTDKTDTQTFCSVRLKDTFKA